VSPLPAAQEGGSPLQAPPAWELQCSTPVCRCPAQEIHLGQVSWERTPPRTSPLHLIYLAKMSSILLNLYGFSPGSVFEYVDVYGKRRTVREPEPFQDLCADHDLQGGGGP